MPTAAANRYPRTNEPVGRAAHDHRLLGLVMTATLLATSACQPGEASPTTTLPLATTAAPTTPRTTAPPATTITSATTTTGQPTTAPPTTAPNAPPEELLGQRAIQRNKDLAGCLAVGPSCDIEAVIDEYYVEGSASPDGIRNRFERLKAKNGKWTQLDEIDDRLVSVSVSPDGTTGFTTVCTVNGAVEVDADTGELINDEVGYFRIEISWKLDGRGKWMAISHDSFSSSPGSDPTCDF